MLAKIYYKCKTSTQSGKKGRIGMWVLDFERQDPTYVEPLLGYKSSKDTMQQVKLFFPSLEKAKKYADGHSIEYYVIPSYTSVVHTQKSYQDNFSYDRLQPWTH
ncbi:NADH dehydrogenase ubiquinone Fe-S protein 4 [Candidatus Liberibacter americanus]|nr:NADH dehydrogenase ubiquinone Fe-S protein 4 [Candidatus Liberibacter americanus]EMS36604.1 oxidoreductase protein [Candidatus Liberibacter americanus PW_SP]